jgi:hypothetical protein
MVNIFQKTPSKLDEPIDRLLLQLASVDVGSDEHELRMKQLERLMKLKAAEPTNGVSPDTVVTVAGSLLGILIIVAYEQKHVMVSKALGMVLRSK